MIYGCLKNSPLYIQVEIIENHKIIFCEDVSELFEYFYPYRKKIGDMKHRRRVAMQD